MAMSEKDLIKVVDLYKYFPIRTGVLTGIRSGNIPTVKAVDGVSFSIREGEIHGLVGESGCGKTTTGRTILRLIEPTKGQIFYNDINLTRLSKDEMKKFRRQMQIIYQDPFDSLNPKMTIRDIVGEPLEIHGIGSDSERRTMISDALQEVQLTPPEDFLFRHPHELSGGQRQRVAIARALILRPKFIVADEPVSMLDVSIRTEVLNLMLDLKTKLNLTYLFITHDLAIAKYMSDDIGVMYLGKLVEYGDTKDLLDDPDHPYTQALIAAVPVADISIKRGDIPIKGETPQPIDLPKGCRFNPRCPYAFERCFEEEPPLLQIEPGHGSACFLAEDFHGGKVQRGKMPS